MNVYSVDIRVAATAYIKAATPAEALKIARGLHGDCLHVQDASQSDVEISGRRLDDPDLPVVSFSPVMTVYNPTGHLELAADNANRAQEV